MTTSDRRDQMVWTALGVRMGFTSKRRQREEILAATGRINWVQTPARPRYLDGRADGAIVNAVFHHRSDPLRLVGVAQLNGGHQLIGLQDSLGTRRYVLDLDVEAIYVLAEFQYPLTTAQPPADHRRVA